MFVDAYASLYHNSCCSSQLQSPCLWFTSPRSGGFSLIPMIPIIGFTQHLQELLSFFRKNKTVMFDSSKQGLYSKSIDFSLEWPGLGLISHSPQCSFREIFSFGVVEKPNESCSAANFFLSSNGKLWKNKYLELNPT